MAYDSGSVRKISENAVKCLNWEFLQVSFGCLFVHHEVFLISWNVLSPFVPFKPLNEYF